jgi:hypothetical protein
VQLLRNGTHVPPVLEQVEDELVAAIQVLWHSSGIEYELSGHAYTSREGAVASRCCRK